MLLGVVLAELFLAFAEPALVVLLGIFLAELLLALAEPTDVLLLWERLRIRLTLCEAALAPLLRIRRVVGTICGHVHPP